MGFHFHTIAARGRCWGSQIGSHADRRSWIALTRRRKEPAPKGLAGGHIRAVLQTRVIQGVTPAGGTIMGAGVRSVTCRLGVGGEGDTNLKRGHFPE
jgi:hypothetical protein